MNEILIFIIKYCSELYYKYGFRFINSDYCEGDNSIIVLENGNVRFLFLRDRGQLMLEVSLSLNGKKSEQFSFELIRQYISGESELFTILDDNNGAFIRDNLEKIVNLLSENSVKTTILNLKKLEKRRSKLLFG